MLDRWKYLVEQQKKTPLIAFRIRWWETVIIKTHPNHIVIRPSNKRWFQFAGWFGLGLFAVFGAIFYGVDFVWYKRLFLILFGFAMLYASTSSFVLVNKIWWRPNGEKITIFLGSVSRNKIITIARDNIETQLYLTKKSRLESKFKRGKLKVSGTYIGGKLKVPVQAVCLFLYRIL